MGKSQQLLAGTTGKEIFSLERSVVCFVSQVIEISLSHEEQENVVSSLEEIRF